MTQEERNVFDDWFESQIMQLVSLRMKLYPSLDSFTFTCTTGDEKCEWRVILDVEVSAKQENQKCKNCDYLKKLHKQDKNEEDTFICMKNITIVPTEMLGSYSCSNFLWKQE